MAGNCLPLFPRIVLGIIDPLAVAFTSFHAITAPGDFYLTLVPEPSQAPPELTQHMRAISTMIGALMIAISASQVAGVWVNKSVSVITWIMLSQLLADIVYLYAAYIGVGEAYFWDPSQWNSRMWGLVITDMFFNVTRLGAVLGIFGPLGGKKAKSS
ncbi:hypothetical protein BX600DRAFT_226806 [Xylariales sp. PMI_506]|nr:hypothetical protein BX600DRAFT_226806 [Xylariales sp. PMI_506]